MRAAKTDKLGFRRNPSFSETGVSGSCTLKQFSEDEITVHRRHRPQKKQDNRSKRQARLGRDKYHSSPGSPCCLRVSQLSERLSSRCVRRTILQSGAVRSGNQDLSAGFSEWVIAVRWGHRMNSYRSGLPRGGRAWGPRRGKVVSMGSKLREEPHSRVV